MKIGLFGNCQVADIRRCLALALPENTFVHVQAQVGVDVNVAEATVLDDCDVLIVQKLHLEALERSLPHLKNKTTKVIPNFYFAGFHPDIVYAKQGGAYINGLSGHYHSSLVVHSYKKHLSHDETVGLFCEAVFRHLKFFDYWDRSRQHLRILSSSTVIPLDALFSEWVSSGIFCYSVNHPKMTVLGSIAREIIRVLGLKSVTDEPQVFLSDSLVDGAWWPVYPEIAKRLGVRGSYVFRTLGPNPRLLDLNAYIAESLSSLSKYDPEDITCERLSEQQALYDDIVDLVRTSLSHPREEPPPTRKGLPHHDGVANLARTSVSHPYRGLPPERYWRKAVAGQEKINPVIRPKFSIGAHDRIVSAGSCFAQEIAKGVLARGYNYHVTETPPPHIDTVEAIRLGYGTFSARYGNIYTPRHLVQLFDRAYSRFTPAEEVWTGPTGEPVDPFRPSVPVTDVHADRQVHFGAVRSAFEEADVFAFTLGLTEAWRSKVDGAIFPLAPGVAGGSFDGSRHEFVNFTVGDIESDLAAFLDRLTSINRHARVILTVSPVPLVATFEDRHVIVSTIASKSILRAAVEKVTRECDHVDYFPSYEIATGAFSRGRYFGQDLRTITPEGVEHIMSVFDAAYFGKDNDPKFRKEFAVNSEIVCDERLLDDE